MEGDFRRPARRPDAFGGRPQPQPAQRPIPVTDLRPQSSQPAATPVAVSPQPVSQTFAPAPAPAIPAQAPVMSQPKPTTAELIARHERDSKPKSNSRRNLALASIGLLIIITGALLFAHHSPAKANGPFPATINSSQVTIPVYFPKNLPSTYKVSGYKVVKQDVLNYVVSDSNNDYFYVNIQAVPSGYDFSAFNKRFSNPESYTTAIGSATAGLMNNQLVCSIVAGKSWVMINTTAIKATSQVQTIAQALKPASL